MSYRSKFQSMELRYIPYEIRKIEGMTRMDRILKEEIRRRLQVEAVLEVADRKKDWKKRIEEMLQESW